MIDPHLFATALLCWMLANYAIAQDPVGVDQDPVWVDQAVPAASRTRSRLPPQTLAAWLRTPWSLAVALRSLVGALLLVAAGRFQGTYLAVAAVLFVGSLLVPWCRRLLPVKALLELELAANGGFAFLLWIVCSHSPAGAHAPTLLQLSPNQTSALCLAAALVLYTIRGGNFLVSAILEKAGTLPAPADATPEASPSFAHGRLIGQTERLIVVLIIFAGNLQALAFFFAAKGLIRSRELEQRPRADYFLLGSLASFLVALAAGLILQRAFAALWN